MALKHLPRIESLHLADVVLPENHPMAGEPCVVQAFLVRHPQGNVLVDTGVGADHSGIEQLYRPIRRPLGEALAAVGLAPRDIAMLISTHLHFDHCGENRLFPGVPIYVQADEYEAARQPLYTIQGWVDFPGARYELLHGDAELREGLHVVPTPGHTAGHQSVVLEAGDAVAVIAGQAAYSADEFASKRALADENSSWDRDLYEKSLASLRDLRPLFGYFSHDPTVWQVVDETRP